MDKASLAAEIVPTLVIWTFCAILVSFLTWVGYLFYIHRLYAHLPGPKRSSFFLGNIPEIIRGRNKGLILPQQISEWLLQHGRTICIYLVHRVVIITVEPEIVKEILVIGNHPKSPNFYRPIQSLYGQRFVGSGLGTNLDEQLYTSRRAHLNKAFKYQTLRNLMGDFNTIADDLMNKLSNKADGKTTVLMADEFTRVAIDILGKVAFATHINSVDDSSCPLPQALFQTFAGLYMMMVQDPTSLYIPNRLNFKRKTRMAVQLLRERGWAWVTERKAAMDQGQFVPQDLLTHLIHAAEPHFQENKELTMDEIVTFMLGGQETSANSMAFAIMELGRHPDILDRVRREVDDVLGQRSEVTYEDLGHLEYMSQVIKETMRLHTIVIFSVRRMKYDFTHQGQLLPQGTDIMVPFYAMGRMPDFYPDPLKFDPDRFSRDAPSVAYTQLPFSGGPRTCIGQNFAKMELKVVLAKFLQHFNFHLDPNQSFGEILNSTLKPKDGVQVTLSHRDQCAPLPLSEANSLSLGGQQ